MFKNYQASYSKQELQKAHAIAAAHVEMGFDAIALSGQELIGGVTFIQELTTLGLPLVSANINRAEHELSIPLYISRKVGNLTVGITALTDTPKHKTAIDVVNYNDILPELLQRLDSEHDIIILLSNLDSNSNRIIAKTYPEIDLLISSDRSLGKMSPKVINGALMTQVSSRGKYLGKIEIEWKNGSNWTNDRLPPVSLLKKRQKDISNKIHLLVTEDSSQSKKQLARLQLQLKRLDKDIAFRLSEQSAANLKNRHRLSFIPVRPVHSTETMENLVKEIDSLRLK